jgi:hypothetical protein
LTPPAITAYTQTRIYSQSSGIDSLESIPGLIAGIVLINWSEERMAGIVVIIWSEDRKPLSLVWIGMRIEIIVSSQGKDGSNTVVVINWSEDRTYCKW